ncbi:MAG: exosortase-associated EpsI family protein [Planctomycetota bacterium]
MMHSNLNKGFVATAVGCVLATILSGVVHGRLDGRWSAAPKLTEIGSKLNSLPDRVGQWELVEEMPLPQNAQDMLRCFGSTNRVYQNIDTGDRVNFAVMFGRRGPIAVHTPEVCYTGRGTKQSGPTRKEIVPIDSVNHSIWTVSFADSQDNQPKLEVLYAWSVGEEWVAADSPRFWLTENLYKIQLAGPPPGDGQESVALEFFRELIPQLQSRIENTN